jgi:hypothetical protein
MSVNVRYRTLDDDKVGERVTEVDHVARLLQILDTEAPFGVTVTPSEGGVDYELVVGMRGGLGAIYYTDEGGSWYSRGDTPEDDGPVFAEVDFPSHCEIPRDRVKEALQEFMSTGGRPGCVEWQEDPYSSTVSG